MDTVNNSLQKFYSDDEFRRIYGLARFFIEVGQLKSAETICKGLTTVRPEQTEGWLGLCYCLCLDGRYPELKDAAIGALKSDPKNSSAYLFHIIALFGLDDIAAAGTELGELGEILEQYPVEHADILRIYRSQLARYHNLT